jgi:hypothetical protein
MPEKWRTDPWASIMEPDENNLNREWVKQPKLMYDAGRYLSKARTKRDIAYAAIKVIQAEVYKKIREDPHTFRLPDKPTEAMVSNEVFKSKEYKEAVQKHLDAQEHFDLASTRCDAIQMRCKALENLVKLYAMNYYGEPRTGGEIEQSTIDEMKKKAARKPKKRSSSHG